MKKVLIIVVGMLVLLTLGFFALNSYIYNEKQGENLEAPVFSES